MRLTVTPSRNRNGSRASSNRGQLFDGTVDGRIVVRRSPQPLLDACRILVAEGVDPATRIAMRHAGSEIDALTATVGGAAGLTVWEGDKAPHLRPWNARKSFAEDSPSGFSEGCATPVTPTRKATPRSARDSGG